MRYLNFRVYTRERRLRWVCGLVFQSRKKKRGSFLCSSDMLIANFIWDQISIGKCVVYQRKWLESHWLVQVSLTKHIEKNKGLLEWKGRKMLWNCTRGHFSKITETALPPGLGVRRWQMPVWWNLHNLPLKLN